MKKSFIILAIAAATLAISCKQSNNPEPTPINIITSFDAATPATTTVPSGNNYAPATTARNILTADDDYITKMAAITDKIEINLADENSWDSAVVRSGELVTVTTTDSKEIIIKGSTSSDTAIFLANKKEKAIKLTLENASFTSKNYPCIEMDKNTTVYFAIQGQNTLTDGRKYGTNYKSTGSKTKGSIYIKGQAILYGSGSLTLNEGYKHGIYSTDYIRVFGGRWTIKSTGRNAFQSVNGFIMDGGEIKITGTGTYTNNESRGIVVEGLDAEVKKNVATPTDYPGEGFIVINRGSLDITTVGKAITAKWDIKDDAGTPTDTTDDPFPYVMINDGTINIKTTGTPKEKGDTKETFTDADGEDVSEKVKLSTDAIGAKQAVIITGGSISIDSTSDGISASRKADCPAWISISGGNIFINAKDDAIDSNGDIYISGGIIEALATDGDGCAFDCNDKTLSITGGLLAGFGSSDYTTPKASQGTFILPCKNASGTLAITDAAGKLVFAYDNIPEAFANNDKKFVVISSPNITKETYTIKGGASATGGEKFNNLYTTLPKISGGDTVATLTTTENDFVKKAE